MIDLKRFGDLDALNLGEFRPKQTSFSEGQVEAAVLLWASDDGVTRIGVWECTPGRFSADRSQASEICHILSGTASVQGTDRDDLRHLRPGDILVLPIGWVGEWTVHETLRKTYVMTGRA